MSSKSLVAQSCAIALGTFMFSAANLAHASLIGQTGIGCSTVNLGTAMTCNTLSPSVGAGPEFDLNAGFTNPSFLIDIGEDFGGSTTIEITQAFKNDNGVPGGTTSQYTRFELMLDNLIWLLPPPGTGNDPDGKIVGFMFAADPGVSGVTAGDVSFTDDSLAIDFSGSSFSVGPSILITLEVEHGMPVVDPGPGPGPGPDPSTPVSEPAAMAMLGFGLVGLGFVRRRRGV